MALVFDKLNGIPLLIDLPSVADSLTGSTSLTHVNIRTTSNSTNIVNNLLINNQDATNSFSIGGPGNSEISGFKANSRYLISLSGDMLGGGSARFRFRIVGGDFIGGSEIYLVANNENVTNKGYESITFVYTSQSESPLRVERDEGNSILRGGRTFINIVELPTDSIVIGDGVFSANNGVSLIGNNAVLGGTLTGNTSINTNGNSLVFGTGITATTGLNAFGFGGNVNPTGNFSFAEGRNTYASGNTSHAEGRQTCAIGDYSHVEGYNSITCGNYSHAEGYNVCAIGSASHAEGCYTIACGNNSHAEGYYTIASGNTSHAGGRGTSIRRIIASGSISFNHSQNTLIQGVNHGALADNSAILGGINHNIESGNTGATIIGGNSIKLTGTQYIDTAAFNCAAIFLTPEAGGSEDVLTWNSTTRKINKVTQASVSDERLKTNLQPINNSLIALDNIDAYKFEFNELTPRSGDTSYGVLANEVEKEFPSVVKENYVINGEKYKTVEYKELIPVLWDVVKKLKNRIEILENKLVS